MGGASTTCIQREVDVCLVRDEDLYQRRAPRRGEKGLEKPLELWFAAPTEPDELSGEKQEGGDVERADCWTDKSGYMTDVSTAWTEDMDMKIVIYTADKPRPTPDEPKSIDSVEEAPEWAAEFGLQPNHPGLLRQYHAQHRLDKPEWLDDDDDDIWDQLKRYQDSRDELRAKAIAGEMSVFPSTSGHQIYLTRNGAPAAYSVSKGEVSFEAHGWIVQHPVVPWTSHLLLVIDEEVVCELYEGEPKGPYEVFDRSFTIKAGRGLHMLWWYHRCGLPDGNQSTWTIGSMADTRKNFKANRQDIYPGGKMLLTKDYNVAFKGFLGWLVVE